MRKRQGRFARTIVLAAFLLSLAVNVFSLDMTVLNGVWTWNIMAVGSGTHEYNFSWGKGKFTSNGVIFFDLKERVAGISEEGLFEIRDLKQEDANTAGMTIYYDPKKNSDASSSNNSSDLRYFSYWGGSPDRSYFVRVHFESYNKIWLEMPAAYWREGKDNPRYRMSGPPRKMAGADFEPVESVFGERMGDFCYIMDNGTITVTKYLNNTTDKVDIPSVINGMPVKAIGYGAFVSRSNLKSVNIPRGVIYIEDNAFGAVGLTSIVIPDGVVSIGDSAFLDCAALTSVVIPESVADIGGGAFAGCVKLKSVVLSSSITSIESSTFLRCSSLETITLPESVTEIAPESFAYCSSLKSIMMPAGISGIWYKAFSHCSSLASIELPAGLSYIGPDVFEYCSSLKTITIPQGVRQIELEMFRGCDNLISVKLFRRTRIKLDDMPGNFSWKENEEFMKKVKIEYILK
jgi:hypothetical protein